MMPVKNNHVRIRVNNNSYLFAEARN